jgi:hypothetical protein
MSEQNYLHKHVILFTVLNCIGGVMVSVLASVAIDLGVESQSGQTKNYKIGICYFSAKHVALRRKSKDWFARNRDNMFGWDDMSIRGLVFQGASTIKIQLRCWSSTKQTSSSWKIAELVLNNNDSLTHFLQCSLL